MTDRDSFTIHSCQLRPESAGVFLKSPDAFDAPGIDLIISPRKDRRVLRERAHGARYRGPDALYRGAEMRPGADVRTDSEIDA